MKTLLFLAITAMLLVAACAANAITVDPGLDQNGYTVTVTDPGGAIDTMYTGSYIPTGQCKVNGIYYDYFTYRYTGEKGMNYIWYNGTRWEICAAGGPPPFVPDYSPFFSAPCPYVPGDINNTTPPTGTSINPIVGLAWTCLPPGTTVTVAPN